MMMCRLSLAMVVAVRSIFHLGICTELSCDQELSCPSALYKDGSIVRSLARRSNNSKDTAIVSHLVDCHTSNACLNNPCRNRGSCLEDNTGSFHCHCKLGFDGETCDILAQLLIITNDEKQVLLANVSDFSFSALYTTDDEEIDGSVFDEEDGAIFYAHDTPSGKYDFGIRMATGMNTSIDIFNNNQCLCTL
ncbi:uncharacterized protein LOC121411756 isoform X2 [Lytechinus variegatus]|uniref:uncharacterized protein LOC121411756 isoform X2 n=1 Tax=Lytechinus variegatus TaxID=7654 RepID=UPI001BB24E44|nr:uncharacterized protein LOC121411756 isoform X2 [Lytechinus variegatus]